MNWATINYSNVLFLFFPILSELNSQGIELEPEVEGRISNVTFPAGREAVLTCSVKNLGRYKVHTNKHTILYGREFSTGDSCGEDL